MLWTAFPDTLDTSALTLLLAAWRGQPVDQKTAVLAAFNVAGYAYGRAAPKTFGAAGEDVTPTNSEVESAFASLINAPVGMAAAPEKSAALSIILPIVLALLRAWLSR